MEDSAIVDLYLSRNEDAIRETDRQYGPRLLALALGILADRPAAEECQNDAYWTAWRSIPPHQPRTYLYPFLARITRHLALNRCRERQALKRQALVCTLSQELEACLPAPDDAACRLEEQELAGAINGFLRTLPAEARRVFLRRYWYCDSIHDIARRCACSESRIKSLLFRTRNRLRAYLQKEGYDL